MANQTAFSKAWRYRCKNGSRFCRAQLKRERSRLNRREGKIHLEDACIFKLSERDVI